MQLTIEKLVYGGDGLARAALEPTAASSPKPAPGASGKAVFVPFVLAGEQVEATVVESKPGFSRARAESILQPSPERVEPRCPYFAACGGCHYQHAGYDHQLAVKARILAETVRRLAKTEAPEVQTHASPPWQYRNRTRMKVRGGHDFALGYYRFSSHDLLPVEQCPISSPLINRAIQAMWQVGRAGLVSEAVVEIEFFANAEDNRLLVELTLPDKYWTRPAKPALDEFVAELRRVLPEITGVAAFRTAAQGALVREEVPQGLKAAFGEDELVYHTHGCEFHVSAGSFFQTNRYLTDTLLELVTAGRSGDAALDLYAGTGLFTLPLSQTFRQVTAVEAAPFSFHDLKRNTPSNVKAMREPAEAYLAGGHNEAIDLVVVDPPRGGLGERVAKLIGGLHAPRLTYVSCDPATLARDLTVLLAAGFRMQHMHLLDLFPQTFHIESVTELVR